jgi:hypothetical protein
MRFSRGMIVAPMMLIAVASCRREAPDSAAPTDHIMGSMGSSEPPDMGTPPDDDEFVPQTGEPPKKRTGGGSRVGDDGPLETK